MDQLDMDFYHSSKHHLLLDKKAMTPNLARRPLSSSLSSLRSHRASSTGAKAVSPHVRSTTSRLILRVAHLTYSPSKTVHQVGFYKSFGRPIAKVFLGAMFTYQITYLLWHKLEIEETKAYKTGTVPHVEKI